MSGVSGNQMNDLLDLAALRNEPLHPDLVPYVEDGPLPGMTMLRHRLVYVVPLTMPGLANKAYTHKKEALAEALAEKAWHAVVFLHERPYRLSALVDYVTGHEVYDEGTPVALDDLRPDPDILDLVADVWVDSENIEENVEDWRALIGEAETFWLGSPEERAAFDALPDPIPAWRGGVVGAWSWTTEEKTALFFARRSGFEPRFALIPKADVFGYLTRRGESELLVRLTDEREPLVYPHGEVSGNDD